MRARDVTKSKTKPGIIVAAWLVNAEKSIEMALELAHIHDLRVDNVPIMYALATLRVKVGETRQAVEKTNKGKSR